jgi:hypothetical protein
MKRYIIERDIPDIGSADREALRQAAKTSNGVLAELAPKIQWIESYVAGDKTFCVYMADNEDVIHEHAKKSGFPATRVTEIRKIIDPTTEKAE